jgi:hypothetical protein
VKVGGDDRDGARLTGGDLRLSDRERVDETEAGAADVEGSAIFTSADAGVKLGGERRIKMMGLAGGDNGIDLGDGAGGGLERYAGGLGAKGDFGFVRGSVASDWMPARLRSLPTGMPKARSTSSDGMMREPTVRPEPEMTTEGCDGVSRRR